MATESSDLKCPECGIHFGIPRDVYETWVKVGKKSFSCPNKCQLHYKPDDGNEKKSALTDLRAEVQALKDKLTKRSQELALALKEAASHKEALDAMTLELEIWRPQRTSEEG